MTEVTTYQLRALWNEMLAELRGRDDVTIVKAELGDPVPEEVHGPLAEELGVPLTSGLAAYLGFANGIMLDWRIGEDEPDYGGSIHIGDLRVLRDPDTHLLGEQDGILIPAELYGLSVEDSWLPFDFFKRDDENFELAGLLPNGERLDVFVTNDEIAAMDATLLLGFGEYIELVLRAFGSPLARAALEQMAPNDRRLRIEDLHPGILSRSYSLDALIELTRSSPDVEQTRSFFR